MKNFQKERDFIFKLMTQLLEKVDPKTNEFFISLINENTPQATQKITQKIFYENKTFEMIKAFSLYNILLNILEERYRIQSKNSLEKIPQAYQKLIDSKLNEQQIQQTLSHLVFYPVFTAHPTESRRRTFLEAHHSIYENLHKAFDLGEYQRIKDINYRLHLLWQTHFVRNQKLEVLFELDNLLFIVIDSILPSAQKVLQTINQILPSPLKHSVIKLGSWIGGDRDGNPFVSNHLMIEVMKTQHQTIIKLYLDKIQTLIRELSIAQDFCHISEDLIQSIQKEQSHLDDIAKKLYQDEPFRAKLVLMKQKLQNRLTGINTQWHNPFVYRHIDELIQDIELLEKNLTPTTAIHLQEFKNLVLLGNFYLLKLDFREHKQVFINAISEIFSLMNLTQDFTTLSEDKKITILNQALESENIDLLSLLDHLSTETQNTIQIFSSIIWGKTNIAESIVESFILSMTTDASDLLIILFFAKASKLWIPNQKARILITPLFETIQDLRRSRTIMHTLNQNHHYSLYIKDCNYKQEIMIGYSDSSKDGGIFSSNFNLYQAISDLIELGQKLGITFHLFHGKGGSVSRGGGSLSSALMAAPHNSVIGRLKVTEQGEMISSKYLSPKSAEFHFANTLSALLKKTCYDHFHTQKESHNQHQKNLYQQMEIISQTSMQSYRDLVYNTSGFIDYFKSATPIDFIQKLNLGSRPSKRKDTQRVEDLRAIPWVFAWTQNRSIITAWYGLGSGFSSVKDTSILRDLYLESNFFRSTIDNISQAFLKVDLEIAKFYNDFVEDKKLKDHIWNLIQTEYQKTMDFLLLIRNEQNLLDSQPMTKEPIFMRKTSVDILNLLQIHLIKQYHQSTLESEKQLLMEEIHSTIVGIAQGMRNTG